MGAAAPFIALGMQVAGGISSAIGANKAERAAARQDEENARLALLQGSQEAYQTRREERRLSGDMLAAMGMSGTLLTGSNRDLIAENAFQRELEIQNIRAQAIGQHDNYMQSAKDHRRAGKNALISGLFSTVGNAIGGFSEIRAGQRADSARGQVRSTALGGSVKVPVKRTQYRGAGG